MKRTDYRTVEVITDICCDVCGASVVPDFQKEHKEDLSDFSEFGMLRASYGYGSSQDGTSINFDLCEACFKEVVDKVKNMQASVT